VEAIIHEMRARGFPCDVVNLDPWWMGDGPWSTFTWDTQRFPDPATMIRDLRAQGVHVCLWVTPYVPAGTPIYAEGVNGGFFVRRADGRISPVVEAFAGRDLAAVDFTNPAGREWFLSKLQPLLDMGVTVFKTDFGEQAPVDAVYYDGRSGLEVHNLYPLLYNRAVYELTERANGRGLVYARSAYAGSQRYPLYFGGDSYSSLDQMMAHLWGLLSYGMSGVPFCSHDVGGFDYPPRAFDEASPEGYPTDPVVYTRWLQFGVFSSHLRAHGKQPREPWACGPQVEAIARRYLRLRYRLLPYLYSEAVKASQTGLPMLRPMVLEFQSDTNTRGLDLQYMLGESFLVAPVVDPLGRCHVYLPAGEWVDFWSKDVLSGARWIDSEAPLETLPVWVRGGSVVPLGPEMDYVDEKPLDPLTLEIYAPRGSVSYTLHDEDRPDIAMRYEVRQSELAVEVGPAPGRVEITLCGVRAASAGLPGQPLTILDRPGGQCVGFDGRAGHRVIFELEGRDAD
jgi:alpha-D-xyloside xylohydrolase